MGDHNNATQQPTAVFVPPSCAIKRFRHIFITGDTHGNFVGLHMQAAKIGIGKDDLLIILGDVGVNYYGWRKDDLSKQDLSSLPCTILCIHGNHEMRPTSVKIHDKYVKIKWMGDDAYVEPDYPNLIFAEEGARYKLNEHEYLVVGGAYSVDKYYRLQRGWPWFADEQLTGWEKKHIKQKVEEHGNQEDYILCHTCPRSFEPTECYLSGIDQSTVDKSMEDFLQELIEQTKFNSLYCGHWHIDKDAGKVQFLYHSIVQLA